MENPEKETLTFLSKAWVWILYIVVGIIGKFSHDLIMGRKLTWLQVLSSIGIALFMGFLSSVICYTRYPDYAAFIVPVSTLLSEKIIIAIFSIDFKKLVAEIAQYWADKFRK